MSILEQLAQQIIGKGEHEIQTTEQDGVRIVGDAASVPARVSEVARKARGLTDSTVRVLVNERRVTAWMPSDIEAIKALGFIQCGNAEASFEMSF